MQKIKLQLIFPTLLLCVLAAAAGCITGALTAGFGRVLLWIGTFRTEHLISCVPFLPIAGVCMVWIYQKYGRESSQGMSLIFDAADGTAKRISLRLIPLLIGSTWLTHLCGGSAGREGVAVQLGAAVSHNIGSRIPWFRSIPDAVSILTIAGMAAGFSGLFHAPLAAVCFALEVLAIGKLEYRALLPAAVRYLSGIRRRTLLCRRFRQCFQYMARSDLHRNRSVWIRVPTLFRHCLHRFPPLQRQPFHVWQTETGSAVFAGAKIRHIFKKPYMIAHVRLLFRACSNQFYQRGLRESRFSSGMHTPPHRFPRIATGK